MKPEKDSKCSELTMEELEQVSGGGKPTHVNVSVVMAECGHNPDNAF